MSYGKIAKNTSVYTLVSLFSKSINFLLLPLYTSYLSTEEYGIIGLVTAFIAFLSTIYTLSLTGAINRFYAEFVKNNKLLNNLFSTIFIVVIGNATFWTIIALLSSNIFSYFIPGINFYPYIFWGLITVWLRPIYLVYQKILQSQQDSKKAALLDLTISFITIIITLILLIGFNNKAEGVIKAQAFAMIFISLVIAFTFFRKLKWEFDARLFKKTLNYSLPLVPHSLAGISSTMMDRFVINKYLGTEETGLYNIAYQFGNLSNVFTMAFNQAYVPWFNEQMKSNNKSQIKVVAKLAIILFSIGAMGLSLFSKEVLELITHGDFIKGFEYVPYLAFGYAFNGVYFIYSTSLFYDIKGKGVKMLAKITVSSAFINLVLNFMLIPVYGIIGAAFSFVITKIIFATITGLVNKNAYNIEIKIFNSILIVFAFFIASLLITKYFNLLFKVLIYIVLILIVLNKTIRTLIKLKILK